MSTDDTSTSQTPQSTLPVPQATDTVAVPTWEGTHWNERYYVNGRKRYICALGLSLILFISALDMTIVAVALPTIGGAFGDYQETSWIVTSYLLTYTSFLPIVSKLTDILGRKPVLVGSTLFFMLWSGACGGAKSMSQLIAFRTLQGIGGSAIYSGVIVTISTMVPLDRVAAYSALIGAVFALSSVAGPLIGGAIVQNIHWGWIFFVNLPVGAIGAALLMYSLSDPKDDERIMHSLGKRVDWAGNFFLLAFSVLFCLALQIGGTPQYPWKSATVLVPLILSFFMIPPFIYVETRQAEPLVPLRLFRIWNIALIMLFTITSGAGFFSMTIFLPQRMQVVDGTSPVTAGVRMIPMLVFTGFLSPFAAMSVMLTMKYRPQMWVASSLASVGAGLVSTLAVQTNNSIQYGGQALVGISFGVTITISTIIVQFCVDRNDLASATGFQTFVRMLGALVGIAISTALLNGKVHDELSAELPPAYSYLQSVITQAPAMVIPDLPAILQNAVRQAYSDGFSRIFIQSAAWFALSALTTWPLKVKIPDAVRKTREKRPSIEEGLVQDMAPVQTKQIQATVIEKKEERPSVDYNQAHETMPVQRA